MHFDVQLQNNDMHNAIEVHNNYLVKSSYMQAESYAHKSSEKPKKWKRRKEEIYIICNYFNFEQVTTSTTSMTSWKYLISWTKFYQLKACTLFRL